MAAKQREMNLAVVDVKFKDLREAVVALNESGLIKAPIKLVGSAREDVLKAFVGAMDAIEDVEGKFPGPKAALDLFNTIVEQEEKAVKKTEKGKKEDAKATTKDAKKAAPKEKKAAAKKEKVDKGPGVIGTILEIITEKGPITKQKIIDVLAKKFPDRDADKMAKTVTVQLGGKSGNIRMEKEKGVKFVRDEEKGTYAIKGKK